MNTPQDQPKPGATGAATQLVSIDAKRWAQRADSLQFSQLQSVRSVAQNWRTGLAGLTSLLSVTSIVVAPGLADKLSGPWRPIAGVVALAGLLALLYGTWEAMFAAFGVPGQAVRLSGEGLRKWESATAIRCVAALKRARWATIAGLLMLIVTTAVVIFAASNNRDGALVQANGASGCFCGHIGHTEAGKLEIIGKDGSIHQLDIKEVTSIEPISAC